MLTSTASPVHPHGRGEHSVRGGVVFAVVGSSPRAWGTLALQNVHHHQVRFIPTGVGNTRQPCQKAVTSSVHPHGRGEHCAATRTARADSGSSPRAWGTPRGTGHAGRAGRFIPTGVGNTCAARRWAMGATVHPHGRGEHKKIALPYLIAVGSSPRAWGTPPTPAGSCALPRFIPTGVGNTSRPVKKESEDSVHPHGRGEHGMRWMLILTLNGSSPRAWGTPFPPIYTG